MLPSVANPQTFAEDLFPAPGPNARSRTAAHVAIHHGWSRSNPFAQLSL